jgi:hypothetical protein
MCTPNYITIYSPRFQIIVVGQLTIIWKQRESTSFIWLLNYEDFETN